MIDKVRSLSVFFPAYNDAPSLPELIEKTFTVVPHIADVFEVIVVNDGSSDATASVLAGLQQRFGSKLIVIEHPENRGYGGALRTGFAAARHDVIFYTDGDGQYDVAELPLLVSKMANGVGLVNGYKLKRHDPWHRVFIGWSYNKFARLLFQIQLRDIDCDFRLIRRDLVRGLNLQSNTGSICVELVRGIELSGCGVVEVGVHHYPRLHGRSQFFRVRSLLTTFRQLAALHWRLVMIPSLRRLRPALWAR